MGLIINRADVSEFIKNLRKNNKTIVTTNGCFDILHVGHVRYLQKTKSLADYSIVLLNSDNSVKTIKGNDRPINKESDRAEILCALSCVDYVIIFDESSPEKLIAEIQPDVHTKGADYTVETLPEAKTILSYGGKIEFIPFVEGKSTTSLIAKIKN